MSEAPLMPKATAVWLVENTSLAFDQVAGQEVVRRVANQGQRDSFDQAHVARPKNMPSDQTPGGSWPSANAMSASS